MLKINEYHTKVNNLEKGTFRKCDICIYMYIHVYKYVSNK